MFWGYRVNNTAVSKHTVWKTRKKNIKISRAYNTAVARHAVHNYNIAVARYVV